MDSGTLASVRKKHKLFRRWLQTHNGQDYTLYARARNQAKKACRQAQKQLEKEVAAKAKKNPKAFWSYVKSKTNCRTGVADLRKADGTKTTTDEEKVELLNKFFQSVFTQENMDSLPDPPDFNFMSTLEDINIKDEKVLKILKSLQTDKAPGPDGISPLVLSKAAEELAKPIALLYRLSLARGTIPDDWKCALVTPIFKKGSRMEASNYRPVSLTSILCKALETIVREELIIHLRMNNLICEEQHGFVHGRSCVTNLLEVLEDWTQILDAGGSIDAIYMDFRKAFDTVPHCRLLSKVRAHGIRGKVWHWIKAFLSGRSQSVRINGTQSSKASVTSGIPQGSVLGPMLFVIYINDLPRHVSNPVKMFADDTKLYARSDEQDATEALQDDLDKLQQWSRDWQLRFHPEKCSVLKLGANKSEAVYYMTTKSEDGEEQRIALAESDLEKDLGVFIDNKLKFKAHVAQAIAKANKIIGIIRRSFDFLDEKLFLQLYKSLVRPILEYGHSVWQPWQKTLQSDIENVQRRATKLLPMIRDLPYSERLEALKLPSLEHRRKRGDMIDTYKYVHGLYKVKSPKFILSEARETRGNTMKIQKGNCRLNVRSNFFTQRIISTWNSLPDAVVAAPSTDSFKNRLDAHWQQLPTLYEPECCQ